jgi:hypothetical protein
LFIQIFDHLLLSINRLLCLKILICIVHIGKQKQRNKRSGSIGSFLVPNKSA